LETGKIKRITGISIASAVLYNVGILSPFFAVPLQFSAAGRRKGFFLLTSLISMILILSFRTIVLSPLRAIGFIYLDALILFLAVSGLYVCNFMLKSLALPVRVAVVTVAAGVLSLLLYPLMQGLKEPLIQTLDRLLSISKGSSPMESSILGNGSLNGETLFMILKDLAGRTGFVWYFFFITFSRLMGNMLIRKLPGKDRMVESEEWLLPEVWVWFLFLPLTLFLLNKLLASRGMHFLGILPYYAVTNATLIAAGAYALRGLKILQVFMKKKKISRQLRIMLLMTAGFLIVIPGINLVILILSAGLGVSELWINYRLLDKE